MNIIYIAYSCNPYNGTEDKLGWFIPYYTAKSNNVFIITKEESREYISKFIEKEKCENISVCYVDIPQIYKKIYKGSFYSARLNIWNKRALKVVEKLCDNHNIDIIHQVNPVEFRSIGAYGKIEGVPFICGPVGGGEYIPKPLRKYIGKDVGFELIRLFANNYYKIKYKMNGRLMECDKLIFANNETKKFLVGAEICDKYKVMTELGSLKQEKNAYAKRNDIFTILSGGRLIYRKGFDLLLDAVESVPEEYEFQLKLVGNGPMYKYLKKRIESSRILKNRVEMLGKIPHVDMGRLYRTSDVFFMPSLRETTGSVILEALENGIPVVAANMFGARIVLNDKCGFLYEISDKEEVSITLKNVIEKCIKNKKILQKMGNDCLKRAEELSFENKIEEYKNIYYKFLVRKKEN